MKIDAFSHILTPNYYQKILQIDPNIPEKYPFVKNKALTDLQFRLNNWPENHMKQVLSFANISPEDFVIPAEAADICELANNELGCYSS